MDQAGFDAYQKEQGVSTGAGDANANAQGNSQGNSQQQGNDGGTQVQDVLDALSGKGQQAQAGADDKGTDGGKENEGGADDKGSKGKVADAEEVDMFEQQEEDNAGEGGDEGGADDISDEDKKVVQPLLDKALAPVKAQLARANRENAINTFLQSDEGQAFKPYEATIRKYAHDKKLSHLKVQFIAYAIAGPKLMQMGGEKGIQAYKEAKGSMVQGNQARPQGATVSESTIANMPKDQFQKLWGKVRNTPR